jgi:hypothetical protein
MVEEREEIASPREEHRGSPSREHWSKPMTLNKRGLGIGLKIEWESKAPPEGWLSSSRV